MDETKTPMQNSEETDVQSVVQSNSEAAPEVPATQQMVAQPTSAQQSATPAIKVIKKLTKKQLKEYIILGVLAIVLIIYAYATFGGKKKVSVAPDMQNMPDFTMMMGLSGAMMTGGITTGDMASGDVTTGENVPAPSMTYQEILRELGKIQPERLSMGDIESVMAKLATAKETYEQHNSNFGLAIVQTGGLTVVTYEYQTDKGTTGKVSLSILRNRLLFYSTDTERNSTTFKKNPNGSLQELSARGTQIGDNKTIVTISEPKDISTFLIGLIIVNPVTQQEEYIVKHSAMLAGNTVPYMSLLIKYNTKAGATGDDAQLLAGEISFALIGEVSPTGDGMLYPKYEQYKNILLTTASADNGVATLATGDVNKTVEQVLADENLKGDIQTEAEKLTTQLSANFASCTPIKVPVSLFGATYVYEILGPKNNGCEIKSYYEKVPEGLEATLAGDMTCVYDNKLVFDEAVQKLSDEKFMSCTGELAKIMGNRG